MSDKKHIDRLFQEKFKDFDVSPNATVWEGIEARIQKKKKKRRVIPIWWQLGGVAAALVVLFALINPFSKDNAEIAWWENDGMENFTKQTIGFIGNATDVWAADFDGDNDIDVLGAGGEFLVGQYEWYENDGNENWIVST